MSAQGARSAASLATVGARRWTSVLALAAALAAGLGSAACRVNEDDVRRWESTAHGPDKLRAVLLHDKYDNALRVEAAISLVRMKPRAGRRIGIGIMVDTLALVSPESRQAIVAALVPQIVAELKKPAPVGQAGQPSPPDGSFPYKDAAYAILTQKDPTIINDEPLKQSLKLALIEWAMADFEHRLDNRTQAYGMEQLLRLFQGEAVVGLPKLMTRDSKRLDQIASLVAELGDQKTKDAASAALVTIAKYVTSDDWVKAKKPELQAANAASKLEPTEVQFKAQLVQYQDEDLYRVFGSMKKVGGRPAIDFLLSFAAQKDQAEKRRQAALAALEGRLDRNNADDTKRILDIASQDGAPDIVLDQAFRRIGEMPRELVVQKLYDIFKTDKWKVRKAAAATLLRMSTVKHMDEFLLKVDSIQRNFALPEAITYGALLGDLKEGDALDALKKHFASGGSHSRLSAISYYFEHGTSADLPAVQPLESDNTKVTACDADPDCKWSCQIAKEGSKDPKEREDKDIKTVGDFVKYCVEPAIKDKQPEKK
ncbi:MAG TPA: hypothetical protein VF316_00235 [Polyangiaceae bacterium]